MKVTIPEELKKEVPPSSWGKIFSATPVVMAVVSTMLAGLASSEMTRAQYDRALAAQQQSKAGDQWSFFQAKRLRGAYQQNTADLLQAATEVHELDPAALRTSAEQLGTTQTAKELLTLLDSDAGKKTIALLQKGELPATAAPAPLKPAIKAAEDGVENLKPDTEIRMLLSSVSDTELEQAIYSARDEAQTFDAATKPINQTVGTVEMLLGKEAVAQGQSSAKATSPVGARSIVRDFTAARLRYAALRYEAEARLNQAIAGLYELQVRKSNISAEHHHLRSQRFFFGMLGAQLAVIISTFAMAARQRNLLWSLAAAAGLIAIAFAVYVYLKV